jgi:glycine/D-amino acid oxidase-like deaminating enzyme
VQALFPHLPPLSWESSAAGWVGMTADQYPHLHRPAPRLIAAVGLSGRGIAFGTLLGREASPRVLERPVSE